MKRILCFLLVCMISSLGHATVRVLTSGDLPYTTVANNDTLEISGTKITSATNGILIAHSGIVILGYDTDSLVCGTGGGSSNYCIRSTAGNNFQVRNLHMRVGTNSSTNAAVIQTGGIHDMTIYRCYLYATGTDAHAWSYGVSSANNWYNITFDSCTVEDSSQTYTDRHTFTGAVFYGTQNCTSNFSSGSPRWGLRARKCNFKSFPSQCIIARSPIQLDTCTFLGDCRNISNPGQTGNCYSVMLRGSHHGRDSAGAFDSRIIGCSFTSGTEYLGCRHIHIMGVSGGDPGRPFEIYGNTFVGHNGDLADGNEHFTIQMENESGGGGHWFHIHDNDFTISVDGSSGTTYRHITAYVLMIGNASTDSGNVIENNTVLCYSGDGGGRLATFSNTANGNPLNNKTVIRNNHIRTGGSAYTHGSQGGFRTGQMVYYRDTIEKLPTDSCITTGSGATYYPRLSTYGRWDGSNSTTAQDTSIYLWDLDITGFNPKTDLKREQAHGAEERYFLVRTCSLTVVDGDGDPVNGAQVVAKDNLGNTRWTHNTDATGKLQDSTIFWKWSHVGSNSLPDTTGYNPIQFIASYDANQNTTIDNGEADTVSLTVSFTNYAATLTISGADVEGGGGDPIDTTYTILQDGSQNEPHSASDTSYMAFTVSRNLADEATDYHIETADSTAQAGVQYVAVDSTFTFTIGSFLDTFYVPILFTPGTKESPKYFYVIGSMLPANHVWANSDSVAVGSRFDTTQRRWVEFGRRP